MPVNSFKWKYYEGEIFLLTVDVTKPFSEISMMVYSTIKY
jgi:hypothetical protein